jgi:RimJ/RimL family protein N-acetyltransferase
VNGEPSGRTVSLRRLRVSDAAALVEYGRDAQMRRWTSVPQPYTPQDAENFLAGAAQGWADRSIFHFAVESEGRLAGVLDLRPDGGGVAEIGFGLMPWARGRGVMSGAVRQLAGWAFGEQGLSVLHWRAQVGNWQSRRVAWAVGFRVGPPVAGLIRHRGERVDGWIAALRAGERLAPAHPWYSPARISVGDVLLRELGHADIARIAEAGNDPWTRHWMSGKPAPYTETDAEEHLRGTLISQADGKALFWAVADPHDDRLLGEIGLFVPNAAERQGEIGYWTHPDSRGRGLATVAVRSAARHALLPAEDGGLGLVRLGLRAAAGNVASHRVAQKAGFTRTGVDRRAERLRDGSLADNVRFDLLPDELPAVR